MDLAPDSLLPFLLTWNLRNVRSDLSPLKEDHFCITGTSKGIYPIDGWKDFFLEVPSKGRKKDIVGRTYHSFGIRMRNTEWDHRRVIQVPVYNNCDLADIDHFKFVVEHWLAISLPEDVPCLCLALKCRGVYSEGFEAQSLSVLSVWSDSVARMIALDWSEGSVEDCGTPEWFIETTPLMSLDKASELVEPTFCNISWEDPSFSIYLIPCCIGRGLKGEPNVPSHTNWNCEWRYVDYISFKKDLDLLIPVVRDIFNPRPGDSDGQRMANGDPLTPFGPGGGES